MPGLALTLTVGSAASQWAVTTRNAFGRSGSEATRPDRYARDLSQACGPKGGGKSIHKHGPPPWGMKIVGCREAAKVRMPQRIVCRHLSRDVADGNARRPR